MKTIHANYSAQSVAHSSSLSREENSSESVDGGNTSRSREYVNVSFGPRRHRGAVPTLFCLRLWLLPWRLAVQGASTCRSWPSPESSETFWMFLREPPAPLDQATSSRPRGCKQSCGWLFISRLYILTVRIFWRFRSIVASIRLCDCEGDASASIFVAAVLWPTMSTACLYFTLPSEKRLQACKTISGDILSSNFDERGNALTVITSHWTAKCIRYGRIYWS